MKKQKTAKLDLGGQKVDVGIPSHLLSDLGATVYFGALARLSKDKRQHRRPAQRWGGHVFVRAEVHQEGRIQTRHQRRVVQSLGARPRMGTILSGFREPVR